MIVTKTIKYLTIKTSLFQKRVQFQLIQQIIVSFYQNSKKNGKLNQIPEK